MAIDWQAFWLTLQLAIAVSAILLVLGLPIAYWIAFSRRRWKFLVEAVVALPIVLPPTVLGFYVLSDSHAVPRSFDVGLRKLFQDAGRSAVCHGRVARDAEDAQDSRVSEEVRIRSGLQRVSAVFEDGAGQPEEAARCRGQDCVRHRHRRAAAHSRLFRALGNA